MRKLCTVLLLIATTVGLSGCFYGPYGGYGRGYGGGYYGHPHGGGYGYGGGYRGRGF